MIRTIPVDSSRTPLLFAGTVEPVHPWIEKDGRRQPAEEQECNDQGVPMWTVHALVPGGENARPEVVAVRVPARECPAPEQFAPVAFERLEVRVSVNRSSGQLGGYWSAAGIADPRAAKKPEPAKSEPQPV